MKIFSSVAIVTIMIALSGCTGASEENPTITLKGDTDITLKVGQLINDPGYIASDPQDGVLTDKVQVDSNLDYYRVGTYYVKYSVEDSDGHVATATRTVHITENGANDGLYSGDYQYGDVGSTYYDFATYNYNYLVREEGKTIEQEIHEYTNNAERIIQVVFEKNKNDGSIYEYDDNKIQNRDYIGIDTISSIDSDSVQTTFKRNIRTNEPFADETQDGIHITCQVREHLGTINTQNVTQANILDFNYTDVLHAVCTRDDGLTMDTYFANGWGEVLSITKQNGTVVEYTVLDKNSMHEVQ